MFIWNQKQGALLLGPYAAMLQYLRWQSFKFGFTNPLIA